MKRILALTIAVMLLVACLPVSALAAGNAQLVIGSVNDAAAGVSYELPFSLVSSDATFSNYDIEIAADSRLTLTAITKGGASGDMFTSNVGSKYAGDAGITDKAAQGVLFTATFAVPATAQPGDKFEVSAVIETLEDSTGTNLAVSVVKGIIEIPVPPCDHANKQLVQGDDEYHWYDCDCGATGIDKAKHDFGAWEKVDDAKHAHTCSVCGKTVDEGHEWDEGKVTTPATHTTDGVKTYTCSKCGATYTETIPADADAHTWGKWTWVNGTQTHSRECACGENESEDCTLTWKTTKNPTATKAGEKVLWCAECKHVYKTETIPADPSLDDVPGTGDITPVLYLGGFGAFAMIAAAAYVLKRKFAR